MKKLIALALVVLVSIPLARAAGVWCSFKQRPGAVSLMRPHAKAFHSANELYASCDPDPRASACTEYVAGVTDGLWSLDSHLTEICLPDGVVLNQAVDVVVKWLKDNPAQRHYSASSDIEVALREAFPCESAEVSKSSK